jgi:hypothetical protein
MDLPEHVTQLLENLQRQVKELQARGGPSQAAQEEEARLEEMRRESRFQGLGKGMRNPNEQKRLKYPGWRFHISGEEKLVERPDQEPKGDGWFSSMAEYLAAKAVDKHDLRPALAEAFARPMVSDPVTEQIQALPSAPEPALKKPDGRSKAAREAKKKHGADA